MPLCRAFVCLAGLTAIAAAQSTTFNYTGSVQTYTVPPGVNQITIDAAGAAGGPGQAMAGGNGARLAASFAVTPGETLNIVVGGVGVTNALSGGGGGGSFVYLTPAAAGLLIAAAGGGGGGLGANTGNPGLSNSTTNAASSGNHSGGTPGTLGNGGGGGASADNNGGGGGGLLTNGGAGAGSNSGSGGQALVNGAAGGAGFAGTGNGGFGGGGGAGEAAGGGGGGFNGGGGGETLSGGGGGGSFSASVPSIATDGFETSNGYVIITVSGFLPTDAYQTGYANLALADSFINLTNNGATDPATAPGTICANVYVFDPSEEELACCSCLITPNALQSMSVRALLFNTLTGEIPLSATVALLGSAPSGSGTCDPSAVTAATLVPGLRGWNTAVHSSGPPTNITYGTELPFAPSGATLSGGALNQLTGLCSFIRANGSGSGQCSGCTTGGR